MPNTVVGIGAGLAPDLSTALHPASAPLGTVPEGASAPETPSGDLCHPPVVEGEGTLLQAPLPAPGYPGAAGVGTGLLQADVLTQLISRYCRCGTHHSGCHFAVRQRWASEWELRGRGCHIGLSKAQGDGTFLAVEGCPVAGRLVLSAAFPAVSCLCLQEV